MPTQPPGHSSPWASHLSGVLGGTAAPTEATGEGQVSQQGSYNSSHLGAEHPGLGRVWAPGSVGCSGYPNMLGPPGDARGWGCSGPSGAAGCSGHHGKAAGAQLLPPVPREHHGIRTSTYTDVSKQLISSATATSLPCPQGDQGRLTLDWLRSTNPSGPSRPAATLLNSGWPKGLQSPQELCACWGPSAHWLLAPCPRPHPGQGPNPCHWLCGVEVY